MISYELEEKIANVSDILEQIEELNKLLDFQKENDADASTIRQYELMRQEFMNELSALLKTFKLNFQALNIAA